MKLKYDIRKKNSAKTVLNTPKRTPFFKNLIFQHP